MAKFSDNSQYSDRYIQALQWAAQLHRFQVRKNGSPYIVHLLSVSALVLENGGSEDEAIAALLHDCVEDVNVKASQIKKRFGKEVAAIVQAVTENKGQDDWMLRKLEYIDSIVADVRKRQDRGAALVATCDKLHNLRSYLSDGVWSEGLSEFHWVFFARVAHAFCHPDLKSQVYDVLIKLDKIIGKEKDGFDYPNHPEEFLV